MTRHKRNIFLTGISGSGKSSVGLELARILNAKFYDLDSVIESNQNLSTIEIFRTSGERYFRKVERTTLQKLIKKHATVTAGVRVIALGGGTLVSAENRKLVNNSGKLVYLKISCAAAAKRLSYTRNHPLLMKNSGEPLSQSAIAKRLRVQLKTRLAHYQEADIKISTSRKSTQKIAKEIIRRHGPAK